MVVKVGGDPLCKGEAARCYRDRTARTDDIMSVPVQTAQHGRADHAVCAENEDAHSGALQRSGARGHRRLT
jgi:hypothetical protein